MQQGEIIILTLVGLVLLAAILIWLAVRNRNTTKLREKFGDEYDRTVEEKGRRSAAEAALEEREKRVAELDIRPLTPQQRDDAIREWREVKAIFVESPVEAVLHADRLLSRIMQARGYPMADFDRRYEDLTVEHSEVARHYREGHEITVRHEEGKASTEDLRQAMIHFEALFDELVNDAEDKIAARPVTSAATSRA